MIVYGVDPGTSMSAIVVFNGVTVVDRGYMDNGLMLDHLMRERVTENHGRRRVLVIEQVESFGMAVGREVFETVFWTGRFAQAWVPAQFDRMPRRIVKQHICHTAKATDANIRMELIDRFGGQDKAIGRKKEPGPLYEIKSHCWAALAVAVTWFDLHGAEDPIRPGVNAEF